MGKSETCRTPERKEEVASRAHKTLPKSQLRPSSKERRTCAQAEFDGLERMADLEAVLDEKESSGLGKEPFLFTKGKRNP